MVMDRICELHWVAAFGNAKNLTFLWMELHKPFPFPLLQRIKILLELGGVIVVIYDTVYNTVISKQTDTGVLRDAVWKVIDIGQE